VSKARIHSIVIYKHDVAMVTVVSTSYCIGLGNVLILLVNCNIYIIPFLMLPVFKYCDTVSFLVLFYI